MGTAAELARRLAREAEAVCRHYLSRGRREGHYWTVGDVHNAAGRSLYVRLSGESAGRWTDAATGEHGDLLDLIGRNRGLVHLGDALDEARAFLALPREEGSPRSDVNAYDAVKAAQCLFARSRPIGGTLAEVYLHHRGLTELHDTEALRFQPRCRYRADDGTLQAGPALVAAVTDGDGRVTGVLRTWLDPTGRGKAAMPAPRRALGRLLGNGVRFGAVGESLAVGEGVETLLALHVAAPALPAVAALSAGHLAAFAFPPGLRRLAVVRDNDDAGQRAAERLVDRARAAGVTARILTPMTGDLNDDLTRCGVEALRRHLRDQLAPEDVWTIAPSDRVPGAE